MFFISIFRRSSKNVLDDDDLELIRENKSLNKEKMVSVCFFVTGIFGDFEASERLFLLFILFLHLVFPE